MIKSLILILSAAWSSGKFDEFVLGFEIFGKYRAGYCQKSRSLLLVRGTNINNSVRELRSPTPVPLRFKNKVVCLKNK